MRKRWTRPSPAMVVATVALFVALGGTGYAALTISGSVLRNGSVTGAKLRPNTLTGRQVNESRLARVPRAARADTAGTATTAATATNASTAANATQLGGSPPASYLQYGGPIPSGRTVTGVWGCAEVDTDTGSGSPMPQGNTCRAFISLPVPAPSVLTDENVNMATGTVDGVAPLDGVAGECTGTAAAPTAPPGHVCGYIASKIDSTDLTTYGAGGYGVLGGGSRFGFIIGVTVIGPKTKIGAEGTWAYTAP